VGADNPRIDELRRRVQTDPASIAFAQLAEEYRRAGEFEPAVSVCRNGLARYPGYHSARVTLARALLALERLDEAKLEFERVLEGAPDNLAAARGLGEIRQLTGESPLTEMPPSSRVAKPRATEVLFDLDALLQQLDDRARKLAESPPPVPPEPLPESVPAEQGDEKSLSELEDWLGAILADRTRLSGT
jgi:tetratricopeptide (TPR) repeat protein